MHFLHRSLIAAATLIAPGVWNSAAACSPTTGYVLPTNYELVQLADAIAVSTAVRAEERDDPHGATYGFAEFRTDKAVKAEVPEVIRLDGMYFEDHLNPSLPDDLVQTVRETRGTCIRTVFTKGKAYVMFLDKHTDGTWRQAFYFMARVNEDYFGEDSLWMTAIRTYLKVQQNFGAMAQLDELDRLRRALSASASKHDQLIAADILRHLQSFSPYKPRAFLEDSLARIERGEDPRFGLGEGVDREAAKADIQSALAAQEENP